VDLVLVMLVLVIDNFSGLMQQSIKDKLANLKQEKQNIRREIDCISPELKKVISYSSY